MQLYRIQQEHLNILAQIEEAEGEIAPHVEQALGFTLEALQENAISVGFMTKHLDDGIDAIDAEMKRLAVLKASVKKRNDWFKDKLAAAMNQFGIEKVETPTLKISFRKSEAVDIEDESLLPMSVKDEVPVSYTVSKAKIKEAIKAGNEVPGASLVTRRNLQIK